MALNFSVTGLTQSSQGWWPFAQSPPSGFVFFKQPPPTFYFLNEPLAYYRIHEEQSVKQARAEKIEEVTTSLLNDSYKLKKINESIKKKSLGLANLRFCYWYLIANNKEKAKEKIQKALELYPLFLADPRWYGLRLICKFPELKNIIHLESFH